MNSTAALARQGHRRRYRLFARSGRPGRRMGLFILSYHRLSGYLSLTVLIHQYPGRFAAVRRLSQRHQRLPR